MLKPRKIWRFRNSKINPEGLQNKIFSRIWFIKLWENNGSTGLFSGEGTFLSNNRIIVLQKHDNCVSKHVKKLQLCRSFSDNVLSLQIYYNPH